MTPNKTGTSRFAKTRGDRRGQMPFSVIAVLLLVVSSASIALLYGLDAQKGSTRIPQERLEELKAAMDDAVENVVRLAYASAVDAVRGAEQFNRTALQERFLNSLDESLARAYPSVSGDIRSSVTHRLALTFLMASLQEAVAQEKDLTWQGSSVPAYFVITGNYSLVVACPEGNLTRTVELDQDVFVPLPLLAYRLARMTAAAAPLGEIESVVQYELATLAQDRVLRGYGSEAKTGARSTEVIITHEDVARAVNLAVLLEELRYFQDMGAVDKDLAILEPLLSSAEGAIDPADLFLRSYQEGGIDLAAIVGQALYARADVIVLRWMDYLGLIDLVNIGEGALEMGEDNLFGVLDALTGGDHDQAAMVEYISAAMAEAGIQEYDYRWYCYGGGDIVVRLPSFTIEFHDDLGNRVRHTFQGQYAIDLPGVDVLASPVWGELREDYRSETYSMAQAMRSYIETVAYGVASHCHLPSLTLNLDPADGRTYLEEIDAQLSVAFKDGSGWIRPAIDKANEVRDVREGLAQAAMDFIEHRWMDLLEVNRSLTMGAWDLSGVLVEELRELPNFSEERLRTARNMTFMSLTGEAWGALDAFRAALMESRIDPLLAKFDRGLSQKTVDPGWLVPLVTEAMTSTTGLGLMTALLVKDTMGRFGHSIAAQGGAMEIPVAEGGTILDLADGQRRVERLSVCSPSLELSDNGRVGSLQVAVKMPWQYDRSNTSYPNHHVTDLGTDTATPYLTQWEVRYLGEVEVEARSALTAVDLPCSAVIPLEGSFTVVAFSGWSLEGVEYTSTATLRSDVQHLLAGLYDMLASTAEAIGHLSEDMFLFLYRLMSDLLSCSTGAIGTLNDILSSGTASLEDIITGHIGRAIGLLADGASTIVGGTSIALHVLGLSLTVVFAPQDSALAGTEDRMRIDLSHSFAGASVSSSLRVLRLPSGEHTIAVSMDLEAKDWSVDLTIDPLTKVYEHQVELRGYMGTYTLELYAPVVERVQKVSLSLSDIPGLGEALRSIPSPVPGTKWHVDAGMEMSFNILGRDTLIINEVELNPRGVDRSREWVELYNPSGQAIDLSGYALVTSRGEPHREVLSGIVAAYGHFVHQFTGQALDNGDVKGFPLQESVTLLDRNGKRVDAAPWLKDLDDDGRTWQRVCDGASQWELREGSRGSSNGFALLGEQNLDGLLTMAVKCFQESFEEHMSTSLDMNVLRDIIAGALLRLEGLLMDSVEKTISTLRFYIDLGLDDLTGTAGGGLTMGLEYDGRAVRDCLEWFICAIGEVMDDPLNPLAAGARAPVPVSTLADHAFVQMGAYMKIGTPDLIKGIMDAKVTVLGTIKVSLGTVGLVEGGSIAINFGLVASGMAGEKVSLGVDQSAGVCYDVWLLKGSLRAE
ncbi:MAG: lamin tail domain-containing protein [Methanomassiliicoccus sp.]|nr:lamin tail domain-containing protein [Methanomassiliicoccus sp.]